MCNPAHIEYMRKLWAGSLCSKCNGPHIVGSIRLVLKYPTEPGNGEFTCEACAFGRTLDRVGPENIVKFADGDIAKIAAALHPEETKDDK